MPDNEDLYAILGVDPQANRKAIKSAYHRLARQYHPDVNPTDPAAEERLKQINAAYEVLSDPVKRAGYDRTRPRQQSQPGVGPQPGMGQWWWHTATQHARSGPHPERKPRRKYSTETMNHFVQARLVRRMAREIIVRELCDWAEIDWFQGVTFVHYAEIIYRCEMARRRRHMQLASFAGVSLFGLLLISLVCNSAYLWHANVVGLAVLFSTLLVLSGLLGVMRAFYSR